MIIETTLVLFTSIGWLPSGHRWSVGDLPVPYCVSGNATMTSRTATQQRTSVNAAVDSWRGNVGLSCSLYDATVSTSGCNPVVDSNDGQHNIFWESSWMNGSGVLGVTWSVFAGNCGNVTDDLGVNHALDCGIDSDIEFNDHDWFWDNTGNSGNIDIESIAVHEYGHFIGLDHCDSNSTCSFGTGVMYSAYASGTVRLPFNDDVQGGCALYPGTPGGQGWPCASASDCSAAPICVNPGNNGYCTDTCTTSCPTNYICDVNPQNAAQMVCLRDDGTNQGLCETCTGSFACADMGECFTNIPEPQQGRCATPCPNPANTPDGDCPNLYTCISVTGGDYCIPKSSDCTDLNNFTMLHLGQPCNTQTCDTGLTCVGICTQQCTGTGMGNCPANYGCEAFLDGNSYCLPLVNEGGDCSGLVSCREGVCLVQSGNETCFKYCTGDPSKCNNAQTCQSVTISGMPAGICQPPGVPPRPDGGVVDVGSFDAGCGCDFNTNSCDPGCNCDPLCTVEPDAAVAPGNDASVEPGQDASVTMPEDAGLPGNNGECKCDVTYSCDPGCSDCDPECGCSCDQSYDCDPGCEECDPECKGSSKSGCSGCTSTEGKGDFTRDSLFVLGLFFGAAALLGIRRIVR